MDVLTDVRACSDADLVARHERAIADVDTAACRSTTGGARRAREVERALRAERNRRAGQRGPAWFRRYD